MLDFDEDALKGWLIDKLDPLCARCVARVVLCFSRLPPSTLLR